MIGTATNEDGASKISAYLAEAGIAGRGVVLNVTDTAQSDTLLADLGKEFGAIGIWSTTPASHATTWRCAWAMTTGMR